MTVRRRSIHQVIDLASSGDSITNDALGIQAQLRGSRSPDSEIWALSAPGGAIGVSMRVCPDLPVGSADDVLIVHVRDPDSAVWAAVAERPEALFLRVHGWQLPSGRPLKTVDSRTSGPHANGSPLDVLQGFDETLRAHHIVPIAIMAVSPFIAALTHSALTQSALTHSALTQSGTSQTPTSAVPPFFPYDEFAMLGRTVQTQAVQTQAVQTQTVQTQAGSTKHDARATHPDKLVGPRILCIGRLEPHAQVEKLLSAMHLAATNGLDDALLIIVGRSSNPAYEVALRELARDLRINVFFGGHCSQPDLLGLMATATMMVSPSQASGFGVRFVEAMAAGVPVVGFAAGALPDTVAYAGLLLSPDDDAEILAEALVALARDTELRSALVDQGLMRSMELAPARSAGLLHHFLDDILGSAQ